MLNFGWSKQGRFINRWTAKVEESTANRDHVGYAIYGIKNGSEVLKLCGGVRNPHEGLPWDLDTVGGVRSVTKAITGILVTDALYRNGYSLDLELGYFDVISRNMSNRTDMGKVDIHNTTVRQQLSHTNNAWQAWDGRWTSEVVNHACGDINEIVRYYDSLTQQGNRVGEIAGYDDKNGWLLGAIYEEVTGNKWQTGFNNLMTSLGVERAYPTLGGQNYAPFFLGLAEYLVDTSLVPNRALPIFSNGTTAYTEANITTDFGYAIGSAWFSARSLAQFVDRLHNSDYNSEVILNGMSIIDEEALADCYSVQTGLEDSSEGSRYSWEGVNWGLGPQKQRYVGYCEIWGSVGSGGLGGFNSAYVYNKDHNVVFACVSNGGVNGVPGVTSGAGMVYDIMKDYIENVC